MNRPPKSLLSGYTNGDWYEHQGTVFFAFNGEWLTESEYENAMGQIMDASDEPKDKLASVANILNSSANIFNSLGLGSLIGRTAQKPYEMTDESDPGDLNRNSAKNNTLLYVVGGVLLVVIALFFIKKKA